MRKLLAGIGLLLLLPSAAWAHATPVEYQPAASATLPEAPTQVRIRFSERPERAATFIEVLDAAGDRVNDGGISIDPQDPYAVSVPFPAGGSGVYIVSWSVVSADDGHATSGAYGFAVGSGSAVPAATYDIVHRLDAGDGVTTWLSLLGHALAVGALVLLLLAGRSRRVFILALVGGAFIIAGEAWLLAITQRALGDGASVLSTLSGRYMVLRAATGGLLMLAALAGMRWAKAGAIALAALVVLFAYLRARVSHAAASLDLPVLSVGVNVLHLLSKDLWIGGVIASATMLPRAASMRELLERETRLGRIVAVGLAAGAATGAYVVWLHLKSFADLTVTGWGGRAVTLTAFAVVLLAVRLWQELRVLPALRRIAAGHARPGDEGSAESLPAWRIMEAVTAAFVLLASSFALITTPPVHHGQHWEATAESQGGTITLEEHPHEDDRLLLTFETDPPVMTAVVTAVDVDRGIGPLVLDAQRRFPGGFALAKDTLSGGTWTVSVTGTRDGAYDATATFTLPPSAADRAAEPRARTAGYSAFFALIAAGGIGLGTFLYRRQQAGTGTAGSPPPWSRKDAILAALFSVALLSYMGFHFIHQPLNGFMRTCERQGGMWHESVTTRDGKIVSAVAVPGCMVGMGLAQRHFADAREFAWYERPAPAIAMMTSVPAAPVAGRAAELRFSLRDPSGSPLTELVPEHDKLLHVLILGQDGRFFSHVHPDDAAMAGSGSDFRVPFVFPQAGRYLVAIDYSVRAKPGAQQFYVQVTGGDAMQAVEQAPISVFSSGGYVVTLEQPRVIRAGREAKVSFHLEKDGSPVTSAAPYLAAPMHLAIAGEDLRKISHVHGELPRGWLENLLHPRLRGIPMHMPVPRAFGPEIDAYLTFPSAGRYLLYGQFMHDGAVRTVRFVVDVKQPLPWKRQAVVLP